MPDYAYELDDGRTLTLDATKLCSISGCDWTVRLGAERCAEHGGAPEDTLYITSETGETTYNREARSPFSDDAADEGDSTI